MKWFVKQKKPLLLNHVKDDYLEVNALTGNKYYYTDYIIKQTVSIKFPFYATSLTALLMLCCPLLYRRFLWLSSEWAFLRLCLKTQIKSQMGTRAFFCALDFESQTSHMKRSTRLSQRESRKSWRPSCVTQTGKISTAEIPAATLGSELAVYLPFFHPAKYRKDKKRATWWWDTLKALKNTFLSVN